MAQAQTVDLARIIDAQKIGGFHIALVAVCFIVVMADGYDIGAAAFAAPALIREWHVNPAALGGLFSAGLFAGLFGPPILGWISDHYGRRSAIIGGLLFFGVFTWASVLAQDLTTLIWLRFIAGIGIAGVLPIATALVSEYAPRRLRATLFILMFSGVTFGGGVPGLIAKVYMPTHGWQILFWVGGLTPIIVAFIAMATLPESIKFLSLKRERHGRLVAQLEKMQPGLNLDPNSTFVIGDEVNREKFSYTAIFKGRLAWITPMFWLSNAINLMIFYFINQWTPTILATAGYPVGDAVLAATAFQFAGTAGRSRHHAAARQMGLHPGADPVRLRDSDRRFDRPAGLARVGDHRPWSARRVSACSACNSATSRRRPWFIRPISAPGVLARASAPGASAR